MPIRGIRGATTTSADLPEAILEGTQELLVAIMNSNPGLRTDDIASAFFTTTEDLVSIYPAAAARRMGWEQVPMICSREIPVPESLPRCIRVLVHWNTNYKQSEINHIYLREAISLRPDLIANKRSES